MASSAAKISLFLLLTLLSPLHSHARDSQFFNNIPTTTNNVVVPNTKEGAPNNQQQEEQPNFLPQNENSYGLYGHESGQNPPSTSVTTIPDFKQPDRKYLPKNYNPVAYVTQPEGVNENSTPFTQETTFTTNSNNNNGAQNYYFNNNNQQQEGEAEEETEFRSYPTTTNNRDNNNFYNGGSSFNSQPLGQSNAEFNGFQPQGMSDTRVVANGKYFYDLNSEKFSANHPYESLRAQSEFNSRNFYENNADDFNNRNFFANNANEFNAEGYQNKQEFQDEENTP